MNRQRELIFQHQAAKYIGQPHRVIEPHLNRRMQERKDRAALRAIRLENDKFMDQTLTQVQTNSEEMLNKAYNTEVTNGLERVQEESDYRTFEVFANKQNGNV